MRSGPALELLEAVETLGADVGADLLARAGVLTGEAAATVGATSQGIVAGDLVNTASRLQSMAEPGTVLVGETTVRATGRAIAFEPLGELTLKGKETPVPAWRALRVARRARRRGPRRGDRASVRRPRRGPPADQGARPRRPARNGRPGSSRSPASPGSASLGSPGSC